MADISHICEFMWYQWIHYNEDKGYPEAKVKLGQYLRPTAPGIATREQRKIDLISKIHQGKLQPVDNLLNLLDWILVII